MSHSCPRMWFGPDLMPIDDELANFAIVGTTRSGKTVDLRLMMQSVLPGINTRRESYLPPDGRAVVYDAKYELYPVLNGMDLSAPIHILNPFDARSYAWDIRRDIRDPGVAQTFVARFFPTNKKASGNEVFFERVTIEYLTSIAQVLLTLYPNDWTFRHFVLIAISRELAAALLRQLPDTREKLKTWSQPEQTYASIQQSINAYIAPLTRLAACMDQAYKQGRRISLRDWRTRQHSVLLIGNHESYSEALLPFNRAMMDILIPLTMNRHGMPQELNDDRNWFFIDEWSDFPPSEAFSKLFTMGAGLGCHAIVAFQSLNALYDNFGKDATHTYLDCCHNVAIHTCYDETAQWASGRTGRTRVRRESHSEATTEGGQEGRQQRTKTTSTSWEQDNVVPADRIANLRLTTSHERTDAIYVSKKFGVRHLELDPAVLFGKMIIPADRSCPSFVGRPPEQQNLLPFTADELRLFRLLDNDNRRASKHSSSRRRRSHPKASNTRVSLLDIRDPNDTVLFSHRR
jgi:type IV secretory pathway TraG/TraD family ATPase VirD4